MWSNLYSMEEKWGEKISKNVLVYKRKVKGVSHSLFLTSERGFNSSTNDDRVSLRCVLLWCQTQRVIVVTAAEIFPVRVYYKTVWHACYVSVYKPHTRLLIFFGLYTRAPFQRTCHQWQLAIQWQVKWHSGFWLAMKHCCHGSCHCSIK